jgi:beta-galactosidase
MDALRTEKPMTTRIATLLVLLATANLALAQKFAPPASPRATYNFNPGWKFIKEDVAGADAPDFDDSKWDNISTPHTWNDVDSYRNLISHGGGDRNAWTGIGWYRKHFKLPAGAKDQKIILEFEGMKQAGRFFVNGKPAGKFENGVTACGVDLTKFVNFDGDNVIAVKVDNSSTYKEEATNTGFQWMGRNFNPNFGGLNHNVWLHIIGRVYQTLPLFENLQTTGIYIYPKNIDIKARTAEVNVEAQVRNESDSFAAITLTAVVVDADGVERARFESEKSDLVSGQSESFNASGKLADAHFWNVNDPYLYDVYTILSVDGNIVDVQKTRTGFRKAEFKGGVGSGGVYINEKFVWLTGYAQRSVNDWAGLGQAYPDWMHDWTARLVKESNANYIRWMHIAPNPADVRAGDRQGIVYMCPAGDSEGDARGRQWEQRTEVMRDTIIYYRNHPSILLWEAGNTVITPEHMTQMIELRQQLDPSGGRVMGTRDNDNAAANTAITPIAEFYGIMVGQDPKTDQVAGNDIFRGYSIPRRDRAPLIETEDFRDEAMRGYWDEFSPPNFGFKPKNPGNNGDSYHWNSDTFALAGAARYASYVANRIDNTDPAHSKWAGYASIYFSDSDADGRQQASTVLRVSGKVDGVRLPKEIYYVSRVMQNENPDIHIIGHWTYPADTKKPVYVAASHADQVELFLNGKSLGVAKEPLVYIDPIAGRTDSTSATPGNLGSTGYVYAFPDIAFAPGTLKAVASKAGKVVAQEELQTAGAPAAIKLTLHTAPNGLQADGSDVALIDFEVVDAQGRRCPTDEARVDFDVNGPVIWRGGLNAGKTNSTNNLYLDTECGINRVAIRSTLTPGKITMTAKRDGLTPATITVDSKPVEVKDGLTLTMPQTLASSVKQ